MRDICHLDLVAMERDEVENHLHLQMIVQAWVFLREPQSTMMVKKYLGWETTGMDLVG